MPFPKPSDILPSEITSPDIYKQRRRFVQAAGAGMVAGALGLTGARAEAGEKLSDVQRSVWTLPDKPTPLNTISSYCNYYEFGPDKDSPQRNAHRLQTRPWSISIEGEVMRPQVIDIDDLLKLAPLEERIYRMRCVEGWSMVVPWVGIPMIEIIKRVGMTGNAKFIEFYTLADQEQMPYIRFPLLDWPYMEALRMDEAMHPLTILAVGLYGEVLPNQNGAPVRLVVPWKYGFKSAKSIVKIRFVSEMPQTTWIKAAAAEYGFYANVNPDVPHRRWSQSSERRLGEFRKRKTLPFNGYAEQVASLYAGMDLRKWF
ncbi:protein-methionine-sulfoxide reductase catalytic subunit MsrP [uncultured Dechloromonas sp.]|uniref:protein-methionine-sulfoxide reductase catalytic subunit MsrP n=1 Tax=uncultured Dechloromonas sp. TaxID=171719 RepID=UPI0026011CCA|nr:protein-methionine-sulfoxide reductase catalytic subunit MsrP [uncultured Dechloromonas sp.]